MGVDCCCLHVNYIVYKHFDRSLHVGSSDPTCVQVDDLIPILSPAVYCGFGSCGSQRFTWWHYFLMYE